MLDACADLLDEVGYDALSTTRIAERAGVAIGSVYQFFPDKRAVIQAVTRRQRGAAHLPDREALPGRRTTPAGGTRSTRSSTNTWRCTGPSGFPVPALR